MRSLILPLMMILSQNVAKASNVGVIAHPMVAQNKFLTTEFTGITSSGGGIGAQVRYTQQLLSMMKLEAGIGLAGGKYSGRGFVGADFQILEDYDLQPRVSIKPQYETGKENDKRVNRLGATPVVSKGFNFWGTEAYPFIGLPFAVNLNNDNTYRTSWQLSVGATARLNLNYLENMTASLEALIKLKDSYTGIVAGLSYAFN